MKDYIVFLTNKKEKSIEKTISLLQEQNENVLRINTENFPCMDKFSFFLKNKKMKVKFWKNKEEINLTKVKAIWYRRPGKPYLPSNYPSEIKKFIEEETRISFLGLYSTWKNVFWVNNPLNIHLIDKNKLFQLQLATQMGLNTPSSLVTNSYEELVNFYKKHNEKIVIKIFHPVEIQLPNSKKQLVIYTNLLTKNIIDQFKINIKNSPVFVQEYIEKELELRITIVGKRIFACAIYSQNSERTKHDWRRYDFDKVRHEEFKLPLEIEQKLFKFMKKCKFNFGAIDMILTPKSEYVFLEVNPSGQWGWIEILTDMPITEAIVQLLSNPSKWRLV